MANKINFVTGETYTLAELFSGERRIIIPDLQRDYCWGDETNKKSSGEVGELVSDFVNNLIELYESKEQGVFNLGMFYGYEIPANHIQLCDGQQRLTTLFLLLGILNKMSGKFRHHLISDYEYTHDDKEPYLNYAIRETSLYFLSDLVCKFFISNTDQVNKIKETDWYFSDYNLDPSIQSMLTALSKIESILIDKDANWASLFGDWVLNKLTFLYYDMENRKNGEETFVVINTTGEPLSVTQNLKPLLIQEKNDSFDNTCFCVKQSDGTSLAIDSCWEQIETWFWQKRNNENGNDTADAGFAEFLRWISVIEQYKNKKELPQEEQSSEIKFLIQNILKGKGKIEFPYKEIPFEKIYGYWKSLIWIYENIDTLQKKHIDYLSPKENNSVNGRKAIGQNDCFVLLPVLKYVYDRHIYIEPLSDEKKRNCMRIYEFFCNLIRIGNVSKAVNTLVGEALQIIDLIDGTGDIVSILSKSNDVSKQILTEEERLKLEILRDSSNREGVENAFWKLQSHPLWNGEILPMITMSQNNSQFEFSKFEKYVDVFEGLFSGKMEHESLACLLRRSMIVSSNVYFRGSYKTFGWEWNDWKEFLSGNINDTRKLFDYVLKNKESPIEKPIENILEKYIVNNLDTENKYYEFAVDDYLLNFTCASYACDMIWGLEDWQICTSGNTGRHNSFFSRRNAYILKEYGANAENTESNQKQLDNNWKVWYYAASSYSANCVVFEYNSSVKLEIRFLSENNTCEIVLKPLNDKDNQDITTIAQKLNFEMKKDSITEAVSIHQMNSFDVSEIKSTVDEVIKNITETYNSIHIQNQRNI